MANPPTGYLVFLHGADTTELRTAFEAKVRGPFVAKYGIDGVESIDGASLDDVSTLRAAAETFGMFTTKRLLVVRGLFSNRLPTLRTAVSKLIPRLLDLPIVLAVIEERALEKKEREQALFRALTEHAQLAREFVAPSPLAVAQRLTRALKESGITVAPDAAALLGQDIASDPARLQQELEKLRLFKHGDPTPLTVAEVEALVARDASSNVFALTDALGAGDRITVVREFRRLVAAGEGGGRLFGMIVNHVRALLLARDALDRGTAARDVEARLVKDPTKLHPYVAKKAVAQAGKLSRERLVTLTHDLRGLDVAEKTGRGGGDAALLDLLVLQTNAR